MYLIMYNRDMDRNVVSIHEADQFLGVTLATLRR